MRFANLINIYIEDKFVTNLHQTTHSILNKDHPDKNDYILMTSGAEIS